MEVVPIVIIVAAPLVRSAGISFGFVDNIIVRLLLVTSVLYAVRKGTLAGLLALLAVFTLLIERNHELVTGLPNQCENSNIPDSVKVSYVASELAELPFLGTSERNSEKETSDIDSPLNLKDNIPHLEQAPSSHDAPAFFRAHQNI
jgi:hypothetical protein